MRKYLVGIALFLFVIASCQKEPFLQLTSPSSISFTDQGGSQSISMTTNRSWTVSSSESWCKVSPTSGEASESGFSITVTCEPNTTYDRRSNAITINAGGLTQSITVSQEANLGLIVSSTLYNVTREAQTIEVEVKTNVKFILDIDPSCRDWINHVSTRALNTNILVIQISANETFEARSGQITLRQTDGLLAETITVNQEPRIAVSSIEINKKTTALIVGTTDTLLAKVFPDNTTEDKTISWSSSNNSIITVNNGIITARSTGSALITARIGDVVSSCSVRVQEVPEGAINLGTMALKSDGTAYLVFWAEHNLGATKPEDPGDHYAWGETYPTNCYPVSYKWTDGNSYERITKYCPDNLIDYWYGEGSPDNKTVLDPEDDAAHVKLGDHWRIPTVAEWQVLIDQCKWTRGNKGLVATGANGYSIFLPVAGYKYCDAMYDEIIGGHYFSSDLSLRNPRWAYAFCFYLDSDIPHISDDSYRVMGHSIRPVSE